MTGHPFRRLTALSLAVFAGLLAADTRSEPPSNVVIITLDTTRADRLPAYGFMDASMPALDRLAREGVIFDQAISVAPLTLPAHTTLFTGLLPPGHDVHDNASTPLADKHTTLAEVLKAEGFRTGAFVGSLVLGRDRGLAQGFDYYSSDESIQSVPPSAGRDGPGAAQRRADQVVSEALGWLDRVADSRFMLWAHFYDPHRPYDPPEPYRSAHSDAYIGEIAFADSQIARLVAALEQRQLLERTIVVVVGDHGESLGDHGERDHGVYLYDTVLRVPLIIRMPSLAPRRVGSIVRLTDIMPTVLDLAGLPAPAMDGVSLRDLLTGRQQDLGLEAYSESEYPRQSGCEPLRALRQDRFKLIDGPRPELYDLERDPFEQRNLYNERHATAAFMTMRLGELAGAGSSDTAGSVATTARVPPDLVRQLAALGYVGSSPSKRSQTSEPARDCPTQEAGLSSPR